MLWVGGSDVINGTMSAGDLGAFVFYAIIVASSLATISEVLGELQRAAGATERLIEILQVESHIVAPSQNITSPQALSAEVTFDDVTFHYPSRPDQAAADHLVLKAEEGKVLGSVGAAAAEIGYRTHQLTQPCLEFGIGYVFDTNVGPAIVLAGHGNHGCQPTDVLIWIGYDQLEEPPRRVAAQLWPASFGDGRVVDGRPVDLIELLLQHIPATIVQTPGKEADSDRACTVFAVG